MSAKVVMDKKEFLLQQIIRAYIEYLEPIGSSQLKNMYNINFSPATIRGYFKKLGDEGYLAQEHISSGRVPTVEALKEYWLKHLHLHIEDVDFTSLQRLAKAMNLTVLIKEQNDSQLKKVFNIENSFLILDFEAFQVSIKYNAALDRFLEDLIGLDAKHITNVAAQVGAYELSSAIAKHLNSAGFEVINIKVLIEILGNCSFEERELKNFLQGTVLDGLKERLYFEELLPSGFLGACHFCKVEGKDAKVLIIGQLSTDFIYFYNNLKGSMYE